MNRIITHYVRAYLNSGYDLRIPFHRNNEVFAFYYVSNQILINRFYSKYYCIIK